MKEAEIVFRADGDSKIGLGHIYRCLALAEMLSVKYACIFAIRNPSASMKELMIKAGHSVIALPESLTPVNEPAYLLAITTNAKYIILDGYSFDELYTQPFSEAGKKVILIDDLCTSNRFADTIINHAPGIKPELYNPEKTKLYLGPAYALLREPFRSSKPSKKTDSIEKLLIAFGGADPENFTCKVLDLVKSNQTIKQIMVITGSAFQHQMELKKMIASAGHIQQRSDLTAKEMYAEIFSADLAIVPSSTVLFEVLATGTLALTGYYVENQRMIYDGFLASGAIQGLGNFRELNARTLSDNLEQLRDKSKTVAMNRAIEQHFDGKIAERILGILESLDNAK